MTNKLQLFRESDVHDPVLVTVLWFMASWKQMAYTIQEN